MVSPDDACAVCQTTRENHGDKNHEFDMENPVPRVKKAAEPPRQNAPKERTTDEEPKTQVIMESFATLLEKLTEKGILDAKDIIAILAPRG